MYQHNNDDLTLLSFSKAQLYLVDLIFGHKKFSRIKEKLEQDPGPPLTKFFGKKKNKTRSSTL